MELSSNRASQSTSDFFTRQLSASNSTVQTSDSLKSQFASLLTQSANLSQASDLSVAANTIGSFAADGSPLLSVGSDSQLSDTLSANSQTPSNPSAASPELRQAFQDFVGQTFFTEMIKACRSGQKPSAYFNGGRAEQIFQGQLDQVLSEELSKSSADKIADPMFDLFMLKRQS